MLDDTLLDDPVRLADADAAGVLRTMAMAGAQVRASQESAAQRRMAEWLDIDRPRALVLLARPGVSRTAMELLAAMLGPSCPVPVVCADVVPSWAGPLDVVVGHTEEQGDPQLAASLERAARHGATIVLSAYDEGPVAAAIAGKGLLIPPSLPVPPELAFSRALATGLLAVRALGLFSVDVDRLADQLDGEAESDQLAHESFVNPAKALALRLAERTPLLWGLDPVAGAVAAHGAHALGTHAGMVCDVGDYRDALSKRALHRAVVASLGDRDIFADPEDAAAVPRPIVLTVRQDATSNALRYQAEELLAGVDVLAPHEEMDGEVPALAAVLALRFELAAAYLGIATGSIGETGRFLSATP